jgi:phosphate transport system substrate-binding protein
MKNGPSRCLVVFTVMLTLGVIAMVPATAASRMPMIITGTGSGVEIMRLMAAGFQEQHPGLIVSVLSSIGSTGAIKAVQEKKIDIGLSARGLKPTERNTKIIYEPYARTAFVFAVQASNMVQDLSVEEIEKIYAGKRTTWDDGQPVRPILRPKADSYSLLLEGISPGLKSAYAKAFDIPGVIIGITDQEAADKIENTPGSFGITSSGMIASGNRSIKALSIGGVEPSLANLSAGKYPYDTTLALVYLQDNYRGAVKDFIDFIYSPEGSAILTRHGYMPCPKNTGK